jgi:mannose-6-phosphate isomerase-like protein (cupin superfamily)
MTAVILPEQRPAGRRGFEIALPAAATSGAAALVEAHIPPAMAGPPLHTHRTSEETYYVISGTLIMYTDGTITHLTAGAVAHITRGTQHTWATPPGPETHFLTLHTPAGYEEYHPAALQLEADLGHPPTLEELHQLSKQYDWELAGTKPLRLLPTGTLIDAHLADAEAAKTTTT